MLERNRFGKMILPVVLTIVLPLATACGEKGESNSPVCTEQDIPSGFTWNTKSFKVTNGRPNHDVEVIKKDTDADYTIPLRMPENKPTRIAPDMPIVITFEPNSRVHVQIDCPTP